MTEGTKYHPLFEHLLFSGKGAVAMSFAEIESVVGEPLPLSARTRREWWSNSESGHSQARAWMRAGYRTSKVDLAGETAIFTLEGWPYGYRSLGRALRKGQQPAKQASGLRENAQAQYQSDGGAITAERKRELFGCLRGTIVLDPEVDLTASEVEAVTRPGFNTGRE